MTLFQPGDSVVTNAKSWASGVKANRIGVVHAVVNRGNSLEIIFDDRPANRVLIGSKFVEKLPSESEVRTAYAGAVELYIRILLGDRYGFADANAGGQSSSPREEA